LGSQTASIRVFKPARNRTFAAFQGKLTEEPSRANLIELDYGKILQSSEASSPKLTRQKIYADNEGRTKGLAIYWTT